MGGPGATRSRDTSHHLRMMEVRHKPARPSYGLSFWRLYNPRASSALHAVCAQGFPRPRPPVQSAVEYVVGVYAAALGRAELRRIRLGYSPTALLVLVPLRPFPMTHRLIEHRTMDLWFRCRPSRFLLYARPVNYCASPPVRPCTNTEQREILSCIVCAKGSG